MTTRAEREQQWKEWAAKRNAIDKQRGDEEIAKYGFVWPVDHNYRGDLPPILYDLIKAGLAPTDGTKEKLIALLTTGQLRVSSVGLFLYNKRTAVSLPRAKRLLEALYIRNITYTTTVDTVEWQRCAACDHRLHHRR